MTVEEIRENAKQKHDCKCEKLKEQVKSLEYELSTANASNASLKTAIDALRAEYDNLMEMCDELTDENARLEGEIKGLKYAIKRLTKNEI